MAFQSAVQCASAAITFHRGSHQHINRLVFNSAVPYDQTMIDDLADALDTAVTTSWLPLIGNTLTYDFVHVRGLEFVNDLESINANGTGLGLVSSPLLPANDTFVIKFSTGFIGRSARGRMYTVGMCEAQLQGDTNAVTTSYANGWVAAMQATALDVQAAGWLHVVLSRFANGAPRTTAQKLAVTNYSYTNLVVDSQRGRLP